MSPGCAGPPSNLGSLGDVLSLVWGSWLQIWVGRVARIVDSTCQDSGQHVKTRDNMSGLGATREDSEQHVRTFAHPNICKSKRGVLLLRVFWCFAFGGVSVFCFWACFGVLLLGVRRSPGGLALALVHCIRTNCAPDFRV